MRTQRASSPQMLALVAQLVSLGSVGGQRVGSLLSLPTPGLRFSTLPSLHLPRRPHTPLLPILQSSSSEPSPQSSNMLQRSEEDRQRWFRHRNSFLSLQWGVCAVGGSGEGRDFRSWVFTTLAPSSQSVMDTGRTQAWLFVKLAGEVG